MVNTGGGDAGGVSKVTAEIARVIAQVPPVVESLTGLNVEDLAERSAFQAGHQRRRSADGSPRNLPMFAALGVVTVLAAQPAADVRSPYLPTSARPGWHTLDLGVKGHRGATVHARRGYRR